MTGATHDRPRPWIWVLSFALIVVVAVSGWWLVWGADAFQVRTVKDLISADQRVHPIEATEQLCDQLGCSEGWRTDYGDFLRFDSEGQAEHWAIVLGDEGRRWRTIVLDMREADPTFEERRYAIDLLFSAHSW